jgi:hypothetical membrane protein
VRSMPRPLSFLTRIYPLLGMAGTALVSLAVLLSALIFSGKQAEPYSLLNHFISELGELGVSQAAWLFNLGLIIAGVLFIPCAVGLGLHLRSAWSLLGMAAGTGTGVFLAGVGVFPMNDLPPHAFTAMWFFRLGLMTVLLFGIAFAAQPRGKVRIRKPAILFSVVAVAAYAGFLVMAGRPNAMGASSLDASFAHRPGLWPLAAAEWAVFFATILWFLGVSLMASRRPIGSSRRPAAGPRAPWFARSGRIPPPGPWPPIGKGG